MRLVAKKRLGGFQLDVDVEVGDRVVVTGPNGSGKSTLLKCISGLWRCGPRHDGRWLYVPPEPQAPKRMKARDYVELLESALGIKARLELMDVNYLDKKMGELSTGMAVRLILAVALSTDLPLALDEPTAFLDAKWRSALAELLQERKPVVVATHDAEFIRNLRGWDLVALEGGKAARVERNYVAG
jgi:ATPase subunit of ABC transporter with duplicated ATPase domains